VSIFWWFCCTACLYQKQLNNAVIVAIVCDRGAVVSTAWLIDGVSQIGYWGSLTGARSLIDADRMPYGYHLDSGTREPPLRKKNPPYVDNLKASTVVRADFYSKMADARKRKALPVYKGKVTFIGGALPGETGRSTITKSGRRFEHEAVWPSIIEPSAYRVEPSCHHFKTCAVAVFFSNI